MAVVPPSFDWTDGVVFTAAQGDAGIRDVTNFLLARPILRCRQTVSQNVTTGGAAQGVTFTTEDVDSSGMHSTSVNTSRATAVYPGWYRASGEVSWPASATGQRVVGWAVNGTGVNGADTSMQGFATLSNRQAARTILVFLNVGDFLELTAFQNSGGTLATDVTTTAQSSIDIVWESN